MKTPKTPSYRLHKPTGQAVVTFDGRDYYLGPHGSPESRAEYDRRLSEWLANGRSVPAPDPGGAGPTVVELIAAYVRHAQDFYTTPGGGTSPELGNIKDALRPVRALYGRTPAAGFGPLALQAVRQAMVASGLCRNTVNRRIGRVKRMFRWAVGNELIPPSVAHGLAAVEGLRAGRQNVRETEPVGPVTDGHVAAVLPHLTAPVRAMVQVQRLTGMRPGEVTRMRGAEFDRSGPVWLYRPARHKTSWRGKGRVVPLGPKAQEILAPWLKADPDAYLFSPADAVAGRNARRRRDRRTPLTPSQARRRPKKNPKRAPGVVYDVRAYGHAIRRACGKAGVPPWGPNRLRHTAATEIRARYGLEYAKAVLGHDKVETTTIYAEADLEKAVRVMHEVG